MQAFVFFEKITITTPFLLEAAAVLATFIPLSYSLSMLMKMPPTCHQPATNLQLQVIWV